MIALAARIWVANPDVREDFIQKWKEKNFYDKSEGHGTRRRTMGGKKIIETMEALCLLEEKKKLTMSQQD